MLRLPGEGAEALKKGSFGFECCREETPDTFEIFIKHKLKTSEKYPPLLKKTPNIPEVCMALHFLFHFHV